MNDVIVHRLREYLALSQVRGEIQTLFPVASPDLVTESEAALGFSLNSLLRDVYLSVANGGFGPTYGLIGLPGGAVDDNGYSVVGIYQELSTYFSPHWPAKLLPICHYGCGMLGCVDCSDVHGPMITWHPGLLPDDIECWKNYFVPEEQSIAEWFMRWLEKDITEPK